MSENLYATPAMLAAELDVDEGSLYSSLIAYLDMASRIVDDFCGRSFYAETAIEEKVDGKGRNIFLLKKAPVSNITSITFDGDTIDSGTYEIWDEGAASVYSSDGWESAAANDGKRYAVTYDAGYTLPGEANYNLPSPIEHATLHIARYLYNNRNRDANVTEEEFPSVYKVKYTTSLTTKTDALTQVEAILQPYKFMNV